MNPLVQFLSNLRSLGVILSLDGERLICNAPKGAITAPIRQELADRKSEILAFLREPAPLEASLNGQGALSDLALSRSQRRLWFLAQMDPANPVYNVVVALQLTGTLNRDALERSLHALVERHESLRTLFYGRNGIPLARVLDGAAWKSTFVDLSSAPGAAAESEARRLAGVKARRPFDLGSESLFEATLFRISEQRHLLLLVVHHIVADGWSLGIISKELGTIYAALAARLQPELPPIDFQYRDYIRWEQSEGEAARRQMPFWLDRLAGSLPILDLAGNRRRPSVQTFSGKRISLAVEPRVAEQIRELCRQTGTTPFMLLLAAFKALLSRYTGLEDILVGSATANRQRQELASLVGFFVNTLVLRTSLSGNPTFYDLLTRIKESATFAYARQDVPFDLLVEHLQPRRSLSHSPLVQVMFTVQNVPMADLLLPGLKVEPEQLDPGIARADLSVEVWPDGEGYRCDFEYNIDILDEGTIREIQSDYLDFLRHALADPSLPVQEAPLSNGVRQRIQAERKERSPAPGNPLSRSQQRLWFLNQLDPENAVYNIAVALTVDGPLRREVLERSLKLLVERHESLRTRFLQEEGVPYAIVEDARDWQAEFVDYSFLPRDMQQDEVLRFAQEAARTPFSLERGSLCRATLLRKSPDQHVIVLVMHHIISDGWSLGVLAHELGSIYQSLARGRECPLAPLQFQFRDFVAWEQQEAESSYAADLQYWRQQLAGELPLLELPADRVRPSVQSFNGRRVTTYISAELAEQLQRVGRGQNATFFMVLLAAFKVLLLQYSGQEDILVGTPTAGRLKREFEGLVGFFINNLVLRTGLNGNPSFDELLQRVRRTSLEAFEHQGIPFDQLVEVLQPERSLDRSPIFQVMFTLQNAPLPRLRLDDMEMKPLDFQSLHARYDLAVDIYLLEGKYRCDFEFSTDIYEENTVLQMQRHYLRLLETVASEPATPVRALSLLSEAERHQIVEEWNRTTMPLPPSATVAEWFQAQAAKSPDGRALVFGERSLTYAALDAESSKLAGVLRSHGVARGTVVGVFLHRSPEMVVALLGILKAGGAYLPLDPQLPAQRIEFLIADAVVPLIVTQTELRDSLSDSGAALLMIDQISEGFEQPLTDKPDSEDLACLIYTSGSTGNPKGTEISHGALVNLLASMLREPGLTSEDTLVAITTLSFDIAGLEIFGPLVCGATLVVASREQVLDPELLAGLLEESAATVMQATPSTWRMLVEAGWMGRANLRMWCGGEALRPDLADSLLARGRELWNLYGPTETTIWSAAHRVKSGEDPILIGKPIGNTEMYILGPELQPVPIGVSGELYIAGAGVARGYWKRPELTEARFVPDPFDPVPGRRMYRTGDLARYRRDGQIQLIGRTDHQIKLRGHRIELGEIEVVIERHPEVLQAVVALHGDGSSQQLTAYIKPSDGAVNAASLRAWLQERLPDYMVPSAFVPLAEIPLTPNGKVDRKRLPKPKASTRETSPPIASPRNRLEERLAQIWSEILRVDRVGVRDNFFDLGGHSLLLIRVHARLRQELDSDVAVIDLFRYPTVESMASWLNRRNHSLTVAVGANS
ncbi:MAG TPA: amino acid adenylation domain-containing protein [Silvibacterium sp.]|nr:amino acid adenylation domain-containing protein [Silvibacterium sp.]